MKHTEIPAWPPFPGSKLDERFSEDQPHFALIYEWLQYGQFSPSALKKTTTADLVYIAGHVTPPVRDLTGLSAKETRDELTKDHKLRMNAERSAAELSMRRNRRALYGCALLGLLATILSVIVVAMITA
jgi:hypothetical protein